MYDEEYEYFEPSESQVNDWNIHNDHQDNNGDEEPYLCDWCDGELNPNTMSDICDKCADEYDRANPHPLDIAEREDREAECFGLEPAPWKGEF